MNGWISCDDRLPSEGQVVETKIIHNDGTETNRVDLKRRKSIWLFADDVMVYYRPTHWRLK